MHGKSRRSIGICDSFHLGYSRKRHPAGFFALLVHLLPDLAETLFLHCPVLTVEVKRTIGNRLD
jgi:hypothetical protein